MQIPFGGEQPLHQRCGTTPQDRMTGQDQFMGHGGQGVTFPDAWLPHGDHIDGCLQKGSALEPFQLQLQGWAKMPRLKGQKGLSWRQARLAQQPCGPSCYALLSLVRGQLKQLGFMREVLFRRLQGQIRTDGCHAIQIQLLQQGVQYALPIDLLTHGPSVREEIDRRQTGTRWVSRSPAPLSPPWWTPGC